MATQVSNPLAFFVRRCLAWVFQGFRPFALIPLMILVTYWLSGERTMVVLASTLPATAVIVAAVLNQHVTGSSGAVPGPISLEQWIGERLLFTDRGGDFALMAVSIDDLDSLEDRAGLVARESAVAQVLARFNSLIRNDDIVALGTRSDYLIGLGDIRPPETENLLQLARRLQAVLDDPIESGTLRAYCTVSVGIVRASQLSRPSPQQLIRVAETTLAKGSAEGVGAIRISHSRRGRKPTPDHDLAERITSALENGEIIAWYQPQLSTHTGEITGFEALARWEHPSRGLISPATFLGIIDRMGLSQRLSEVVLSHALSAAHAWSKSGLDIPRVAVNFGSEELRNPRLADYLAWELDRHNISPNGLVIEVLENVIADSHDDTIVRNLRAISAMGVQIDLDDFGTGYTSIMNIRRFAVSRIKIDRRLISRVDVDTHQRQLVSAILAMAERLDIETLGEGVETAPEHAILAQMGCDHIQGFSIARPMPLGDSFTWIREHRARLETDRAVIARTDQKNEGR